MYKTYTTTRIQQDVYNNTYIWSPLACMWRMLPKTVMGLAQVLVAEPGQVNWYNRNKGQESKEGVYSVHGGATV